MNAYHSTAALVRAFFHAYSKGLSDASLQQEGKQTVSPQDIKQLMLDHYEHVGRHFFDAMFTTLVRLNYKDEQQAMARLPQAGADGGEPGITDYMQYACKSPKLYQALLAEYQRNFMQLLNTGRCPTTEEHLASCTQGILVAPTTLPQAVALMVRVVVKAYTAALGRQPHPQQASIIALLITNANILVNAKPLPPDETDPQTLMTQACAGREDLLNVLSNSMQEVMREMAEE